MRSLVPILALVACGPKAPPPIVIDPATLDEETLNAVVAELIPLVEEAAGRKFATPPHGRLARTSDLEAILEAEFMQVTASLYDAPEWVLRNLAEQSRASAPGVVGKYGIQTRVLYLAPDAVAPIGAQLGAEQGGADAVARLVLAHELTHALQSEVMSWDGYTDGDQVDAVRAVTEGHANFVEQRVADKLGLDAARRTLDAGQGWNDDGPLYPQAFEIWSLYGQGKAFVAHHHAQGGDAAVWGLIEHPPATTSMIFRPATYAPTVPASEDFAPALDGVESVLTEGGWVSISGRAGEMSLRAELMSLDRAEIDDTLAAMVAGTERQAFRSDRRAHLRVMRFGSADAAQRMVRLATTPDLRPLGEEGPAWSDVVTPLDGIEADVALQRVAGPEGVGVQYEMTEAWVARGDLVVQIRAEAFRPGIRLREAVTTVLSRL